MSALRTAVFGVLPVVVAGGLIVMGVRERRRRAKAAVPQSRSWPELPKDSVPVVVPSLGEGVGSVTIVRVIRGVGERVTVNDPVAELSTDKVDTELPASVTGVVTAVLVRAGDEVTVGFPILAVRPD